MTNYVGDKGDEKPQNVPQGARYVEWEQGRCTVYRYSGDEWVKLEGSMSYRPEGFNAETIAKENMPLFKWGTQEYALVIRGIDIGADAMLEALKKMGEHYDKDDWTDDSTFCVDNPGTVVFIPDE